MGGSAAMAESAARWQSKGLEPCAHPEAEKSSATDTEGDLLAYNLLLNTKSLTGPFPFYLMQVEIIYSLYKKHTLCLTPLLSARRGDIKGAGVYIECKALKLGMSHKCSHVCAPKE